MSSESTLRAMKGMNPVLEKYFNTRQSQDEDYVTRAFSELKSAIPSDMSRNRSERDVLLDFIAETVSMDMVQSKGYWKEITAFKNWLLQDTFTEKKRLQSIKGPVSLSEHHYQEKKGHRSPAIWYVFGDIHVREYGTVCEEPYVRIDQLIRQTILDNPNKTIDLMLESAHGEWHEGFMQQGYLIGDVSKFAWLERQDPKLFHEQFPNVRIHHVDVRPRIRESKGLFQSYGQLEEPVISRFLKDIEWYRDRMDLRKKGENDSGFAFQEKSIRKQMRVISEWEQRYAQRSDDDLFAEIFKDTRLDQTIGKIPDRHVQMQIRRWLKEEMSKPTVSLRTMVRYYRGHKHTMWFRWKEISRLEHLAKRVEDEAENFLTLWQDAATLAALFGADGQVSQHAIVYVGNFHARTLRKFLNSDRIPGISTAFESDQNHDKRQCVNVSRLRQPLFSERIAIQVDHSDVRRGGGWTPEIPIHNKTGETLLAQWYRTDVKAKYTKSTSPYPSTTNGMPRATTVSPHSTSNIPRPEFHPSPFLRWDLLISRSPTTGDGSRFCIAPQEFPTQDTRESLKRYAFRHRALFALYRESGTLRGVTILPDDFPMPKPASCSG